MPVTQLDLVSKYIGPRRDDGKALKLNRLGGGEWEKTRNKVRTAVKDMADQLIKLYSQRLHSEGYAFSPDIDMQRDFENRFAFEETSDQLRSIDEIKSDMENRILWTDFFAVMSVSVKQRWLCEQFSSVLQTVNNVQF